MFGKKKEPAVEVPKKNYMQLTIGYKDRGDFYWSTNKPVKKYTMEVWFDFLKWYHCRPQSECYVFLSTELKTMLKRENITFYSIRMIEKEVKEAEGEENEN